MRNRRRAATSDRAAAAPKTDAGPPVARRAPASTGPIKVASDSSSPRTTLAPVSSAVVVQSRGSSEEWVGRNTVNAAVATTTRA